MCGFVSFLLCVCVLSVFLGVCEREKACGAVV